MKRKILKTLILILAMGTVFSGCGDDSFLDSINLEKDFIGDKTPPGEVDDLLATPWDGKIKLTWINPFDSDFAGVRVVRGASDYPTDISDGTTVYQGNSATFVDTGLANGSAYYYSVFAYDARGNYSVGEGVSATTENHTVKFRFFPTNHKIKLYWSADSAADSFRVYYTSDGTDPGPDNGSSVEGIANSTTEYEISGLENFGGYRFAVSAVKGGMDSELYPVKTDLSVFAMSGGGNHTVAVFANGSVMAWGRNDSGQLGNNLMPTASDVPDNVNGLDGTPPVVVSVSAGKYHSTALFSDGSVMAWGDDTNGQLGDNPPSSNSAIPVSVDGLTSGVVAIAAGANHTVALFSNGTLKAWGLNTSGQLGDGSYTTRYTPVVVPDLSGVVAIAAGGNHTIALLSNGTIMTWGDNSSGQLGDGTTNDKNTPIVVPGLENVISISGSGSHTLALISDGSVKSWGDNLYGQLGDGTNGAGTGKKSPVAVLNLTNVVAITGGEFHSMALCSDGSVKAWGNNLYGQLGDSSNDDSNIPVEVTGLSNIRTVSAGDSHSLALQSDGTVKAWGRNNYGQLGDNTNNPRNTPVDVSGIIYVSKISSGDYHSMALISDGSVKIWGDNSFNQFGNGTGPTDSNIPLYVSGLANITAITGGAYHTVAITTTNTVKAWGWNAYGQLGDESNTTRTTPYDITNLTSATAISAGATHTIALFPDKTAKACGLNTSGQLGDGSSDNYNNIPQVVLDLTNALEISAGANHSIARLIDGTVMTWGSNSSGQLGNGTSGGFSNIPVGISSLTNVTAVSAGESHTVVLLSDGTVMTWGLNTSGQLGNSNNSSSNSPVVVSGLSNVVAISAGGNHTLALLSDGTVKAWGLNTSGQLGNASNTSSNTTVTVSGLTNVSGISAGLSHSIFIISDGSVYSCGLNTDGQLGDSTNDNSNIPVLIDQGLPYSVIH